MGRKNVPRKTLPNLRSIEASVSECLADEQFDRHAGLSSHAECLSDELINAEWLR
jgi:hypothetical protein